MRANIQQISQATGFSPATVSNALNHKKGVRADTAAKILGAAESMGYFENARVSAVRFVQFKSTGQIVGERPFFAEVISGVEQECRARGYEVYMTTLSRDEADYDSRLEQILSDTSCGVILLATEAGEADMTRFAEARAPLLLLDNWPEQTPCDALLISNTDSACHAVQYLAHLGHREIGYLKCSYRIKNFFYRQEGYRRALELEGLLFHPEWEVEVPADAEAVWHALEAWLDTSPALPTAFFADNDNIAVGALKAFASRGIRVPEDVSVVGFDDLAFTAFSTPPLTTVHVPKIELGRMAVRLLLDKIDSSVRAPLKTQICTTFIERESVRALTSRRRPAR